MDSTLLMEREERYVLRFSWNLRSKNTFTLANSKSKHCKDSYCVIAQ